MLARSVFLWEQDGHVWARLDTNAREERFRARLCALGKEELVDHVERHEDLLRLNGGGYLLVRFREEICRDDARAALDQAVRS